MSHRNLFFWNSSIGMSCYKQRVTYAHFIVRINGIPNHFSTTAAYSGTRWLDNSDIIWPFSTTMKICQQHKHLSKCVDIMPQILNTTLQIDKEFNFVAKVDFFAKSGHNLRLRHSYDTQWKIIISKPTPNWATVDQTSQVDGLAYLLFFVNVYLCISIEIDFIKRTCLII